MGQLSGGQQKRVALANVPITDPTFLMLDEPTNHLDLEMIEWLEGYLNRGNKTIFMVTHDRFFLDKVCNMILELDDRTIYTYRGQLRRLSGEEAGENGQSESRNRALEELDRTDLDWTAVSLRHADTRRNTAQDAFYELEKVGKAAHSRPTGKAEALYRLYRFEIFECQYVSKAFDDRGRRR